jgi:hypothetical protein
LIIAVLLASTSTSVQENAPAELKFGLNEFSVYVKGGLNSLSYKLNADGTHTDGYGAGFDSTTDYLKGIVKTRIFGISELITTEMISETGVDISK